MPTQSPRPPLAQIQEDFLAILPRIEAHGQICFRDERCPGKKADCLAEMTALSWKWFLRLVRRGKDPSNFISALATFAAKAVKSGRRVCGQEKAKDVLSSVAQKRKGFRVGRLPDCSTLSANPLADALVDNTRTPPDEQACFRLDFPAWLATLEQRNRPLALDMAMGHRTQELAKVYRVSPARVSQLRREFREGWDRFCGGEEP
jgi:hypothetical protein